MQILLIIVGCIWILAWPTICIGCEIASTIKKNKKKEASEESDESEESIQFLSRR